MDQFFIRDLFGISGLNIAWYGVIIACGMVLGVLLAMKEAKRQGLYHDATLDFILIALPVAILCARAYYVLFEWNSYKDNPLEIIKIWHGGLAIYGGVIGGFFTACIFCKVKQIPLLKFLDIMVPSLTLGQAIGRWGNFVNQEAFGNLVVDPKLQFFPYAVYIDALQEWHQATFFYESMWNFLIFGLLLYLRHKKKYHGQLLEIYLIGYGVGRFFIEGLRTDSLYLLPGIRVSQLVSMIVVITGVAMLTVHRYRRKSVRQDRGE